jgi:hypothetical protein
MSDDYKAPTGAVRSNDVAGFDYMSMPLLGVMAIARTAGEGGGKYGRFNYMKGMPVHDILNHVFQHIVVVGLGKSRSEMIVDLAHAAWGCCTAIQMLTLNPELSEPHMLGPGATMTEGVLGELDRLEPTLRDRRASGEAAKDGEWDFLELKEVRSLLAARDEELLRTAEMDRINNSTEKTTE